MLSNIITMWFEKRLCVSRRSRRPALKAQGREAVWNCFLLLRQPPLLSDCRRPHSANGANGVDPTYHNADYAHDLNSAGLFRQPTAAQPPEHLTRAAASLKTPALCHFRK